MTTTAVTALGVLAWVLMAIVVSLLLARVNRLNRPRVFDAALSPVPEPAREPVADVIAGFPAEPTRFVGRAETMAAASTVLTSATGPTAVMLHGMAGAGKTTCAVKLAYRHQRAFGVLVFWSAPADPDLSGDALRLLALALESRLGDHGFAIVEEIATQERWEKFLPRFTARFADAEVLLALDNLDSLLTADGQWRDPRWASLIDALTSQPGPSRVIMTSRIAPAGLNTKSVAVREVPALSRDESLMLAGRLSDLRARLRSVSLARCVLTLTQGHPQLLELANAAAADPPRLAYQLAEIEAAVNGTALAPFLVDGRTRLDAGQLRRLVTTWIVTVAATAPAPARLLLQTLCRAEEADRTAAVIGANWSAVWRHSGQPGEPRALDSALAPLVAAALIATDPVDDPADAHLRIHPGVVEAIHTVTPEPVTAAVDAQLAAWWIGVADGWAIELPHDAQEASQLMLRASVAGARYLLRQHDWNAASCLLERALIRNGYAPATSAAVLPSLRRIAEATGAAKDLTVLGAALRKLDSGEAETLLRRAYDQAAVSGEHELASTTTGELVTLLRDQGRLREALVLAEVKIQHTAHAGFGFWTQLSDQGRRLQILTLLDEHEQVLRDLPALRAQMAELAGERADNDRVNPWNVQEGVLGVGRLSALALERWDETLTLNDEIVSTQRRRGASRYEIARTRFNDHLPLLRLGRLADVDLLLHECQEAFDAAGDSTRLATVYAARADLEDKHDNAAGAVDLQRTSLRLCYLHPEPREISAAHHNLARYLSRAAGNPAEQGAHHLAAAVLNHLSGDTDKPTRPLGALPLPTTLSELTRLVEAHDGVRFGHLLSSLCPDPATAGQALTEILTTVATTPGQSR
ncbi:MAG TPA: AAA family ATPase [Pseudonocardiaceae bacterium]|nr:AAA family ATPase [Pseudonocardiaceae bacterium]